ncbi:MAG TPA: CocE/NonD family hydrolase [Ktedonosporobacter sp.]|nr:CocE/NonD family hydrolase [Ktedonosporobacter sp.]
MHSQNTSSSLYEVHVERQVAIPMADGTILRADVYRPSTPGRYPVMVERVAYELAGRCRYAGEYYASRGYVVVGQNARGRFASEGEFVPFRDDGWSDHRDGYDTILWAGQQPWSNGMVGMLDGSYSGGTQYLLAPTQPDFLKALFVREGMSDIYRDFAFRGGAYQLALHRGWAINATLAQLQQDVAPEIAPALASLEQAAKNIDYWYRHLPLSSCSPLEGLADWYFADLAHPEDGPYWWPTSLSQHFHEVDVPIMHLGGWFDVFLSSTLRCFQGIQAQGKTESCRLNQRLIIGPWMHGPNQIGESVVGELDFGPQAAFDLFDYRLHWYEYWLKNVPNGIMDGPSVRIFLMGANQWLEAESWPLPDITHQPLYLQAGTGQTATSLNNGKLTFEQPAEDEAAESFLYDPATPIESLLTYPLLGPKDHRPVEGRMLTYTSPLLEHDLTVIGPVKAVLYALSSAPDTDWVVRLCDVWPDGRSLSVCDGILRARYRDSIEQPALMHPGQVYRFEIDLQATAQVFQAGHQLRVEVASSDFPRYDRNLNTGETFGMGEVGQIARNTVFYGGSRASHILLPVRSS